MNIDRRMITAMVTPMLLSGEVDLGACAELARILVQQGSEGLVVTGTTGESPTLSNEEKQSIWKSVKSAVGPEVAIIAGATNYSTKESIAGAEAALSAGADAILLTVPYYNKPTQAGLYEHFKAIASAVPLPCILYNVPSRTSLNMTAETTIQLSEVSNIVGIKEASGNLDQIARIINKTEDNFKVWSGNDADTLSVVALGGYGVISVASHFVSKQIKEMIDFLLKSDLKSANHINGQLITLYDALFQESNPIPTKWALNHLGFQAGKPRMPLMDPSQNTKKILVSELNKFDIKFYKKN
jgi:4-hydroxy-tetrahydrodipicolinate synthase|tara:strand:+ start:4494 stop:5390 length:897 start_codon:yes stop_codon:yes gene_type:complete